MLYNITRSTETGNSTITVFLDGEMLVTDSGNPNWHEIVDVALEGGFDEGEFYAEDVEWFKGLFDLETAVKSKFAEAQTTNASGVSETLSERVTVRDGVVYVDHDPVDGGITKQIVKFLDEQVSDWKPLVRFLENIMANPNGHSRTQLYDWLQRHDFSLSDDGCFYAYKGLTSDGKSIHAGPGIVNGKHVNGKLDNSVGNVVELPRSDVQFDPGVGCASGLHAGTYSYASGFGHGMTVRVKVNPRDVVSVPTDCGWQKIRTCRYEVIEVVDRESNPAVYNPADLDDDFAEDDWTEADW